MKKIIFSILLIISIQEAFCTHIIGGEMRYEYIGPGSAPNSKQYRIRLLLLRGVTGAGFISQYIVGVFNNDNNQKVIGSAANGNWAAVEDFANPKPVPIIVSPCIQPPPPPPGYTYKTYSFVIELPDNSNGYTVAFQTFSRQGSENILADQGANYSCIIPGLNTLPRPLIDNSPAFSLPISVICENSFFTLDFSATDLESDSLVYSFCYAYDGGAATLADFQDPAPPPYNSVIYTNPPFTSAFPMGPQVAIDSKTGIISGIAPSFGVTGRYVVCVCAAEYRNGVFITVHRKDLIVQVYACVPLHADPSFVPITCDGFNVNFQDNSSGNPTSYLWNFGDPASGAANTSTLPNPSHLYTDTGIYQVKLVVSLNGNCNDSVTKPLAVYPGFLPGYITSPALCVATPIQFTDTTYSRYAPVNSWRWDFGDPASGVLNTSILPNPLHTYNLAGIYDVKLVVTNSKGCIDSVTRPVLISDNPLVTLFPHDTTYCGLDSLQLTASGTGNFNWTPLTFITGGNTATPLVYPPVPTKYIVTLTSPQGCKSRDSLTITPLNDLTNAIVANPPTICEEDTLTLTGSSNHANNVTWLWTPAGSLGSPNQAVTTAFPIVNTTYTLTTTWGNHCVAVKTTNIIVKPLAIPNAGPDAFVCSGGQSSAQLNASGGNTYSWSPTTGLNNPNIPNPIASPTVPTQYVVSVGVTGCPKLRTDTVFVDAGVLPVLTVMNDTLICDIDTLAITTTGTGSFVWAPNYNISSTTAANPLVSPDVPTWYHVRLTDVVGCYSDDSVFIDVRDKVTLLPLRDTTMCKTDTLFMNTTSDGLHYTWSPNIEIFTNTIKRPYIIPTQNRVYTVTANIGKCSDTKSISIKVVPYPVAKAGPDEFVCFGFSTQLSATGGSRYVWNPVTFLDNRFLPNPRVINPTANIRYIVTVTDILGCPKPVKDTAWVYVYPKMIVDAGPSDTTVVEDEPLFLKAVSTGTGNRYLWSPDLWLNDPNIFNPISLPKNDIEYLVEVTSPAGCKGSDRIFVKFYKVGPDMYVPTAFSPNGDGENDILRPILLGMRQLTYFKVFNRFGQMLYSTSEIGKGWDGRFAGKSQDPATYVWMAEGVTYKGQVRRKKGYAVLIR